MDLIKGLGSFFSTIAEADGFFIFLALLAVIGNVFFNVLRWKFSLDAIVGFPTLRNLLPITLGGFFFNNITPIRGFGGEPYRTFALKRRLGILASEGFASIVVERILEALSLLILFIACFFLAIFHYSLPQHVYVLGGISVGMIVFLSSLTYLLLYKKPHMVSGLVSRLIRRFGITKKRTKYSFGKFTSSVSNVFKDLKVCTKVFGCSIAISLCDLAKYVAILLALGTWLSPELVMIAFAISMVAGVIPLSPGGLGTFDLTLGGVLTAFGVPVEMAFAVVLINRGISYLPLMVAGFVAVSYLHLPFKRH